MESLKKILEKRSLPQAELARRMGVAAYPNRKCQSYRIGKKVIDALPQR
jgi:transcriptional regulator with XRE-family HTH domain